METIYQNTKKMGHDYNSFKQEMISICNKHKDENRALAFAFILYDFSNPQVWKIINDKEYWCALNNISGKYLTIFSLNYEDKPKKNKMISINPNCLYNVTFIYTNYNLNDNNSELISKYFGDIAKITYPAILFFQVDNNEVVDSLLISLKEELIENSFLELKEYIKNAVDAISKIKEEKLKDRQLIFDELEKRTKSTRLFRNIKRVNEKAGGILGLISSIKGIL